MEISLKFVKLAIWLLVYSRLSLLLFLGEVIEECVKCYLTVLSHQILYFCLCCCRCCRGCCWYHKPWRAVCCWFRIGGSSQYSVLMLHKKCRSVHLNFSIRTCTTIIEELCIIACPNAAEITQIFQDRLGAIHELLGHEELHFYNIIVVTHTIANVTGAIHC